MRDLSARTDLPFALSSDPFFDGEIPSDAELTELALSSSALEPIDPTAVAMVAPVASALLPAWYMPPARRRLRGWRAGVIAAIVVSLLILELIGLCSVFGQVVIG